jgi:hypothetical protein
MTILIDKLTLFMLLLGEKLSFINQKSREVGYNMDHEGGTKHICFCIRGSSFKSKFAIEIGHLLFDLLDNTPVATVSAITYILDNLLRV